MSQFQMPESVTQLPQEQQDAIQNVLQKAKLLDASGAPNTFKEDNVSPEQKEGLVAAVKPFGVEVDANLFGNPIECALARVAEAAAVVACASIPGGQVAIAACIAAAHELANQACD